MSAPDYAPVLADSRLEDDTRQLIRLAVREDLERQFDWTTVALIDAHRRDQCHIVAREAGVCAGLVVLPWIIDEVDADLLAEFHLADGQSFQAGTHLVTIRGNCRDLLTTERIVLNFLCRLIGIASLTQRYVQAISGTNARLYDTRKTTPGWRRLEKYATRCGGGHNHRTGLFDGFLVKDNHLALAGDGDVPLRPGEAVDRVAAWKGGSAEGIYAPTILEIEVDSLAQFRDALEHRPDIILLDNFSLDDLHQAVAMRNQSKSPVELEASGGINLQTIAQIASTGVERISCGALTYGSTWLDLGMDWEKS